MPDLDWKWHSRSEPTPADTLIWVTDGEDIWLLTGDGDLFPERATKCKFWTVAAFPPLPDGRQPAKIEA